MNRPSVVSATRRLQRGIERDPDASADMKMMLELSLPGWLRAAVVITALAGTASIVYTSLLGGQIVNDSPVLLGPPLAAPLTPPVAPARR